MPNMTMADLQSKLAMSLDDIITKDRKKKPEKKAAGAKAKAQPKKQGKKKDEKKGKAQKTPLKKKGAKLAAVTKSAKGKKAETAARKAQSKQDKLAAKKKAEAAAAAAKKLAAKKAAKSKGKGSKAKGKGGKSKGKGKGSWDSWHDRDDDWYSDSWSKGGKGKGKGRGKGGKGKGKGKGKGYDDWGSQSGRNSYSEWGSAYDGRWDPAPGRPSSNRQRDSFASSGIRPKLTSASQMQQQDGYKISISNLPKNLSKPDLEEAFAACGHVNKVIVKQQFGQGFVWFRKQGDADKACQTYNGGDLNGYKIKVFRTRD